MTSFELEMQFSSEDLRLIYEAGVSVVLAKPILGHPPDVAWLVYRPLMINTISFDASYGLYASNTRIEPGAAITLLGESELPAALGFEYTFGPSPVFAPPAPGGARGAFKVNNELDRMPEGLTFGLFQHAMANGRPGNRNITCAVSVPLRTFALMVPAETVYLWLQAGVEANSIVRPPHGSMLSAVTFGGSVDRIRLAYQSDTGKFVPVGDLAAKQIGLVHQPPPAR